MAPLPLPDPSLVVLIGAAGSGKSTLAARLFGPDEIVSSDALRAVVAGDEADQTATRVAFRILHRTVDRRLAAGRLTVVDATNIAPSVRRPLVARARAAGLPATAIVLDIDRAIVLGQNASRRRVVEATVVDRHLAAVRASVDGGQLAAEGFDRVVILRDPAEVAAFDIDRRPSRHPPR